MVTDKLNPERLKIVKIPLTDYVTIFNFPDEALESLSDKISCPIETTKIMEMKRHEAQKRLQDSKKESEEKDKTEDENQNMNTCHK
jgi:hypothetical protein